MREFSLHVPVEDASARPLADDAVFFPPRAGPPATVTSSIVSCFSFLGRCCGGRRVSLTRPLFILKDITLQLLPGTATLVVGTPGAGTSTLLRLVSGRQLAPSVGEALSWNGMSTWGSYLAIRSGTPTHDLVRYVSDLNILEPLLSVEETLAFAFACTGRAGVPVGSPLEVLQSLHMRGAAATAVGSASGGQRRRTAVAEGLVGNRGELLAFDCPTSGLDSSTALETVEAIVAGARTRRATVIVALVQPSPPLAACFDNLLLLSDGCTAYWGPVAGLTDYLASLPGCPPVPEFRGPIEHATILLGVRGGVDLLRAWRERAPIFVEPPLLPPAAPPPQNQGGPSECSCAHVPLLLHRQARILIRNVPFLASRIASATFMGLVVLGTAFFGLPPSDYNARFGLSLFAGVFIGFTNQAEIPSVFASRSVVEQQVASGWYTPLAFAFAVFVDAIPLTVVVSVLFVSAVYWLTNWAPVVARFFVFMLTIALVDTFISSFFRSIAWLAPTPQEAGFGIAIINIWCVRSVNLFDGTDQTAYVPHPRAHSDCSCLLFYLPFHLQDPLCRLLCLGERAPRVVELADVDLSVSVARCAFVWAFSLSGLRGGLVQQCCKTAH